MNPKFSFQVFVDVGLVHLESSGLLFKGEQVSASISDLRTSGNVRREDRLRSTGAATSGEGCPSADRLLQVRCDFLNVLLNFNFLSLSESRHLSGAKNCASSKVVLIPAALVQLGFETNVSLPFGSMVKVP